MDYVTYFLLLCILIWTCFYVITSNARRRRTLKMLPPGPYPFPIIGNILQIGQKPHQSLTKLSKIYGPLMHLKLGSIDKIVVSSPEIAKQVLQKHDLLFSSRPNPAVSLVHNHGKVSILWLPVGSQWRTLRKICKDNIFSLQRLDESQSLRKEKLQNLYDYVQECCVSSRVVDITDAAFTTSLNLISSTLFSVDFAQFNSDSSQEFKKIVHGLVKIMGKANVADYYPVIKFMDPQGLMRQAENYMGKVFAIFEDIIDQRLKSRGTSMDSEMKNDLLETLLDFSQRNESEFPLKEIKHLLLDLFVAGSETTSTVVEWVMTELIRNPEKMATAKSELQTIICQNEQIEESDIPRLPYLQAIFKETFRLHPPAPFLIPHKAETDIEVMGYKVPKDAQILINVWAIGRDSSIWSNTESFEPERFLDCKINFKGHDFELIPFGSGRRICPALPFAYRMMHLMVAYLIHNFDWKLEGGIKPEEMDINEKFELSLQKAVPLRAIPVTPHISKSYYV